MKKLIALFAASALFCGASDTFAGSDSLIECSDGSLSQDVMGACTNNGGRKSKGAATPIKVSKGAAPIDTRNGFISNKNVKSKTTVASANNKKKTTSKISSSPTAKCNDGAMYFSRERKGACSKHGGVDKWYGW